MKTLLRSSLVCLLTSSMLLAQSADPPQSTAAKSKAKTTTRRPAAKAPAGPTTEEQLRELRDMLTQQQQQIRQLQGQLAARDQQVQQAQTAASEASGRASEAASRASEAANSIGDTKTQVASLNDTVSAMKINNQNLTETIQSEQKRVNDAVESPTAIRFKGATISFTGSFLAGETVWRDRGMAADINTQLVGAPFNGAPNANLSEFNASGRQSRLAILVEGKLSSNWTGRGYYETDWLGAGVTSNSNQSNSYLNRQRQIFAQAESASGWTITGGQMWSLVTETRSGLQNRTEVLPQTIDAQYTAGFSWERQFGFRVTKNLSKKVFLGASVEEAQTLNLGGGAGGTFTFQQGGNNGGLLNGGALNNTGNAATAPTQQNYSYNWLPDFVFKAAFEPGYGHYEVFGLLRGFRDRVYPSATAANIGTAASGVGAFNYTTLAGGIGANARFAIVPKKLDLGFHILAGDGVGRYGDATEADVTARPDGTLAAIRGGSALAGLELHASPKLEVYAYYGGDYDERQLYNAAGSIGYGRFTANTTGCNIETIAGTGNDTPMSSLTNPAACAPDVRDIQELSTGYWYDFYRGSKGRLRQGFQYSYLMKQTWRGTGGSPTSNTNMVFTSFRYYIP